MWKTQEVVKNKLWKKEIVTHVAQLVEDKSHLCFFLIILFEQIKICDRKNFVVSIEKQNTINWMIK
jgi:hypothetical protein